MNVVNVPLACEVGVQGGLQGQGLHARLSEEGASCVTALCVGRN